MHRLADGGRVWSGGRECDAASLVDAGQLFAFQWHDALWLPMFQVGSAKPVVVDGPQRVVAELGQGFDGWALASWFVRPNAWLGSASPIECLVPRLPDVLQAARADRFVASG